MKTKIKSLHMKLLFDMDLNLLLKRKKENIGPRGTPFYNSNKNNLIYIYLRFRRKYISAFFFLPLFGKQIFKGNKNCKYKLKKEMLRA